MTEDDRKINELIGERDAAESALSEAYEIVMGVAPEWSNGFGYKHALSAMKDRLGINLTPAS